MNDNFNKNNDLQNSNQTISGNDVMREKQNFSGQNPKQQNDGNTFSILGIVFGGCSALFSALFMTVFVVSAMFLFLGVAGIILGIKGRKQSIECYGKPTGIATAGFVVAIIGTAISALFILSCLACASCVSALF